MSDLKEEFELAVGAAGTDLSRLTRVATREGARMRRRRQLATGGAVLVVAALVVGVGVGVRQPSQSSGDGSLNPSGPGVVDPTPWSYLRMGEVIRERLVKRVPGAGTAIVDSMEEGNRVDPLRLEGTVVWRSSPGALSNTAGLIWGLPGDQPDARIDQSISVRISSPTDASERLTEGCYELEIHDSASNCSKTLVGARRVLKWEHRIPETDRSINGEASLYRTVSVWDPESELLITAYATIHSADVALTLDQLSELALWDGWVTEVRSKYRYPKSADE